MQKSSKICQNPAARGKRIIHPNATSLVLTTPKSIHRSKFRMSGQSTSAPVKTNAHQPQKPQSPNTKLSAISYIGF